MAPELTRILEAGNSAPSGENCQPWRFQVRGSEVTLRLLPERDQSAYGWGRRASYLACGAAIENMVLAATREGMQVQVALLPDAHDPTLVATLTFSAATAAPDPLAGAIGARVTNRKPYAAAPLSQEERDALCAAAGSSGSRFVLIEDREDLKTLGRVGSTNEELMLGNRALHEFFFSHVNWTKAEDDRVKVGFFIKTLELPPPAQLMFKVFRHWPVMRVLARLGFTKVVAAQNATTNASAAAMGAFVIRATEPRDFIELGRAVERMWLAATARSLSLQPLTGVLFFHLRFAHGDTTGFSAREQDLIRTAYARAAHICGVSAGEHLAFLCRIGHGPKPSAQAVRFPLSEAVEVVS